MHRIMNSPFRLAAVFTWTMLACLPAHSVVEKNSPAAQAMSWESPLLGKSISCAVRLPDSDAEKNPVVVYMKNLPTPRLGELDDETLIKGFLDQGIMVIEADYEGDPRAAAPELLPEIDRWYGYLFRTEEHPVDNNWIYIVPEGYAINRKVQICEVRGMPVAMDVIYPSGQSGPVPLMLQITSTKEPGKWINQRAYYIYGLLTTGYAGAIMDYKGGDRVSPVGRVFPEKQAARLLRANAKKWNLSGKLGVTGHSKGSSRAAKAAFVNEAEFEDDPGPHAEQSARFQVVLASAGQHAKEFLIEDGYLDEVGQSKREAALKQREEVPVEEIRINSTCAYVTRDDPPAFLCVGELDKKFRVGQMKRLAAQCEKVGLEHRFIIQKGMDHMYIPNTEVIGEIFSFFDKYLKTEWLPVTRVTFYSQSVARELVFNIILPAGYENSGKRYPVLYLLHGRGGGLDYWPVMGVAEYVAKLDLIVVMPDVGVSWYVNWAESVGGEKNNWEDCITKDLIGFVDAHYRTVASREGRAISGASMGGYGALTLGFLHPDLFCSVSGHSAALRITDRWRKRLEGAWAKPAVSEDSSTSGQEAEKEPAVSLAGYEPKGRIVTNTDQIDALDPYKLVLATPPEQLPDIRIDCGIDESLGAFSQRLAKLLMEHKITFTFSQEPGRHTRA
ncbi:MAG: alpha/beta hydrolase-fold protein, partial [Planctomycetota bacterium]